MAKHAHTHHHGTELAEAARMALLKSGEQWTEMRSQIFEALAETGKPSSAYDIADAVSRNRGRRVAPNSVYRILDLFVAKNLALRVESANAYMANAHPDCVHDCIFLVCDSCGETQHIDDDSIASGVRGVAEKSGFTAVRPVIEVRGTCATCH
jgi:Fur family transcriptional regulator, zinc uptake regulator